MTDIEKWIDVIFRVSPFLDNTLYAGILLAPLLLSGTHRCRPSTSQPVAVSRNPALVHARNTAVDSALPSLAVLFGRLASLMAATINGRAVPVYRANMAYKAVRLEPGDDVIHFRFTSPLFSALSALGAANAALWLVAVGSIMVGILKSAGSAAGSYSDVDDQGGKPVISYN